MKKKNITNSIKIILITVAAVMLIAVLSFYVLIVCGASKKLQTLWVCTAMTTMNHKHLATWFIPDEKIEEILNANRVDDSGLDSKLINFKKREHVFEKKHLVQVLINNDKHHYSVPKDFKLYIAEGYTKLEDGIYLKEIEKSTYHAFVMLVEDPMRVKLVDTARQYDEGQTVKRMVTSANAIAGLNGGGFIDGPNYDSNGGYPAGLVIENSELVSPIEIDDTEYNMIGINDSGVLVLRHCTAEWALDNNIVSAVSFYPFIVVNGEGTIKNGTGGWGIAPRTAIGQRATGEFLFLVVDGRQVGWSLGCDLNVIQDIMLDEGAENAALLDGGSSTVLFYNGDYINRPSLGHERLINNCFVVAKY